MKASAVIQIPPDSYLATSINRMLTMCGPSNIHRHMKITPNEKTWHVMESHTGPANRMIFPIDLPGSSHFCLIPPRFEEKGIVI